MSTFQPIDCPPEEWESTVYAGLEALLTADDYGISQLANAASFIMDVMPILNWAGFYIFRGGELALGPFQGKPACTRISLNRGVCGEAARTLKLMRVGNVDLFPGHIACDSASKSELVIPLHQEGRLKGVLDLDSPILDRFRHEDELFFAKVGDLLSSLVHWEDLSSQK